MLDKRRLSKKPLIRTCSDVRLKAEFSEFIDDWNTQNEPECHFNTKNCQMKQKPWVDVVDLLLKPVISLCRRNGKQSRRWSSESTVRCHRSSQSVDSDQIPCTIERRRAMSESSLQNVEHVNCIAEFSPERQKKVCFSAPTSSTCSKFEKRCCPTSRPRPILMQKSCIAARQEHMSYSNFKAWRRGSRLSIDVCSMPVNVKESKNKKFERLVKNFLSNCVNQMNSRAIPDM